MTLNEIISASLGRLERGTDAQTIAFYRDEFANYANKAVKKIALKFHQNLKETVNLDGEHTFDLSQLTHEAFKIMDVRAAGRPVDFWQETMGSGRFTCATKETTVDVIYRFVPKRMSSSTDKPELPEYMHDIIPHYVVACARCGGDPSTQGTASADFQLFNQELSDLLAASRGEPRSYKLMNY